MEVVGIGQKAEGKAEQSTFTQASCQQGTWQSAWWTLTVILYRARMQAVARLNFLAMKQSSSTHRLQRQASVVRPLAGEGGPTSGPAHSAQPYVLGQPSDQLAAGVLMSQAFVPCRVELQEEPPG